MLRISIEEAASNLKALLQQVAQGEEIVLVEDEKAVARLVPLQTREQWFADTKRFRDSLQAKGEPLSATVIKARQGERD
ncbi:MAG: type II toxin-antitoxin system Phd/YefM family antitoxin [Lyngbya sp. HA4199-MV5]|jgi:antitoxin (DNA-binding transcriptional repressor) of toxin-antitoxin stability system|nr:type II toxin-antitoxin system Phd/YefM family antitoxin [Lyngbya sp. HA4199-MV5]